MRTRSQTLSQLVYGQIQKMKEIDKEQDVKEKKKPEEDAKTYGSLCHQFPLMVLRSGLSHAVAFVWVKSKGKDDTPYWQFLKHLSALTGEEKETPANFQQRINSAELMEYQRLTRTILAASIWYKRFAESILGVKAGEEIPEEIDQDG
jgi:CRISPR-associated protein Cmr5